MNKKGGAFFYTPEYEAVFSKKLLLYAGEPSLLRFRDRLSSPSRSAIFGTWSSEDGLCSAKDAALPCCVAEQKPHVIAAGRSTDPRGYAPLPGAGVRGADRSRQHSLGRLRLPRGLDGGRLPLLHDDHAGDDRVW